MELAQEKGASTWFSTLPLKEHDFALHKGGFCDAFFTYLFFLPYPLSMVSLSSICVYLRDIVHILLLPIIAYDTFVCLLVPRLYGPALFSRVVE